MLGALFGLFSLIVQRNLLNFIKPEIRTKIKILLSLAGILTISIYFMLITMCETTESCNDVNFYFYFLPVSKIFFQIWLDLSCFAPLVYLIHIYFKGCIIWDASFAHIVMTPLCPLLK